MGRRRRRPRREPARCNGCHEPIKWLRFRGTWVKFAPTLVEPTDTTAPAYPVEARQAWPVRALVDELQGRRGVSAEEAESEAYDMPWHAVHVCSSDDPEEARVER